LEEVIHILNIPINNINLKEAVNMVEGFLTKENHYLVFTPNSEMIMMAQEDPEFMHILNSSDLNVPDGIGVVLASRIKGKPLKERVAGFDLMLELIKLSHNKNYKIYLLGAKEDVVEEAKNKLEMKFPGLNIVGYHHGYFNREEEEDIIRSINEKKPDILFVAFGAPKQEKWIYKNKDKLCAKVLMGVGGSFDVISGKKKRAPLIFRRMGLEWFYRLLKEPWRYKRMMSLPKFLIRVIWG